MNKQVVKNTEMHETARRLFDALKVTCRIDGYAKPGDVARCLGQSPATITNWKTRGVSKEGALLVNEIAGVNPHWLSTGNGEMLTGTTRNAPAQRPASEVQPQREGLVVPVLANSASMGNGSHGLDGDIVTGALKLEPAWVSNVLHPSSMAALRFIHGYGDSMSPTFGSGDILLVDTGIKEVKIDGIYVMAAHDRLFIKRVRQRMDGGFEISSDNPTHKTVDLLSGDHQITVLGRVLWCWNGKGV